MLFTPRPKSSDTKILPFPSVGRCRTRAQRILVRVDGTITGWRNVLARWRTSLQKRDLEHFPSSPAICVPRTSKSKANKEGSEVIMYV